MQGFLVALLLHVGSVQQLAVPISGVVIDLEGKVVPGASIHLTVAGRPVAEARTGPDGQFAITTDATGELVLIADAPGFASTSLTVKPEDVGAVRIMLRPVAFFEIVQVTSSRGDVPQADPNVTTTVFSMPPLRTRAALTVDDALRMVPGFMLARRTSSRVSNPGSQSMTLRGLGGGGGSRSLVLADGVPLNDAFAGWVFWDKVPQAAIDRVEVLRGGGSDLYGADAVGGVVQILTVRPSRRSGRALIEGGNLGTGRVSLFGGGQNRGWSVSGAGEWFTTSGYIMVANDERGAIETPAASDHRSAFASVGYQATNGWRFEGRGNVFSEDRNNGTFLQVNDTASRQASGEIVGVVHGGFLSARVFGVTQGHDQTFSIIEPEPPRSREDLSRVDGVPSRVAGVSLQWVHPWGRHSLLAGAEGRFIKGTTTETHWTEGEVLGASEAGGQQRLGSAFGRLSFVLTDRLTFVAGARGDVWHSEPLNSSVAQTVGAFSPRMAFSYRVGGSALVVRGSAYGGFRAPTLNELYRGFRVGNNVTEPNAALRPETLSAAEGGVLFSRGRVSTRVTGFWNVLDDTITNVTLSTSPSENVRQRQNADKLRSAGVEFEAGLRLPKSVFVDLTSAVINSRFKGNTRLRDYLVPQVANYQFGLNIRYDSGVWLVSGQVRTTGPQFEDDINTVELRRATVVDLLSSRTIARRINAFVAAENIFDNDYDVGRTPTRTIGVPRAIRAGVQIAVP